MSKTHAEISDALAEFIQRQRVFFVATAPRAEDGFINVSPKGLDTLRILGPLDVAYLDLTGSGVETIAHLRENGRIVMMFCAFDGPPKIVRLYGRGTVHEAGEPGYAALADRFPHYPGARSIIRVSITRIGDACGFAVPLFEYKGDRDQLEKFATTLGPDGLSSYRSAKNVRSIDGLTGLTNPSLLIPE